MTGPIEEGRADLAQPLVCQHCGCPIDGPAVQLAATQLAQRLFTLDVCGPCWVMLLAAIELELAGAGPGGHREPHPETYIYPGNVGPGWGRQRDERGRFRPR